VKSETNLTERFQWHKIACVPLLSINLILFSQGRIQHTKDGVLLVIFVRMAISKHGAKVIIFNRLLVFHDKLSPSFLAGFALHLVLNYGGGRVEVRELLHKMFVDIIVVFGELESRASHLFEDLPVCEHVLNSFDGELLLDLNILSVMAHPKWDDWLTSSKLSAVSGLKSAGGGAVEFCVISMFADLFIVKERCKSLLLSAFYVF